jgi:hypothetical protein
MYALQTVQADLRGTTGHTLLFGISSSYYLDVKGSLWTAGQEQPDVRLLAGHLLIFRPINTPYPLHDLHKFQMPPGYQSVSKVF